MSAPAVRAVRYRRHRAGLRRIAVAVRRRGRRATICASARPDVIAAAPAAVIIAERLDVARAIADRYVCVVPDTSHTAAEPRDQQESGARERQTARHGAHFASPRPSASFHSMTPNGAPAGSAITAILPPWRST